MFFVRVCEINITIHQNVKVSKDNLLILKSILVAIELGGINQVV